MRPLYWGQMDSGAADMDFRNGDEATMGLGESNGSATLELDRETPAPKGKAIKMDRKDTGSEQLVAGAAADAMAGAVAEAAKAAAKADSKSVNPRRFNVVTDSARDDLLTDFGKDTLTDRYLLPGESYQDLFA